MISHYWYHFPSADNLWNESKPEEIKCANALLEKVLSPDFILVIFFMQVFPPIQVLKWMNFTLSFEFGSFVIST